MDVLMVVLPQTIAAAPRLRRGSLVSSRRQRRGIRDVHRHRRHRAIQFAASPVRRGCFYFPRFEFGFRGGPVALLWACGLRWTLGPGLVRTWPREQKSLLPKRIQNELFT